MRLSYRELYQKQEMAAKIKTALVKCEAATQSVEAELVNLSEYLASRSAQLRLNPATEGKRVYQIVLGLVLDNGFSHAAKISFPLTRDYTVLDLTIWAHKMQSWIADLNRADRKRFYDLKFLAESQVLEG